MLGNNGNRSKRKGLLVRNKARREILGIKDSTSQCSYIVFLSIGIELSLLTEREKIDEGTLLLFETWKGKKLGS